MNRDKVLSSRAKSRKIEKETGRNSARYKLYYAKMIGKVVEQPCVVCGDKALAHHHFGYVHPLDVVWLCKLHHGRHHAYYRQIIKEAVAKEREKNIETIFQIFGDMDIDANRDEIRKALTPTEPLEDFNLKETGKTLETGFN